MENLAPIVLFVGILVFLAHFFVGIFSKTKIPDVLLLIGIGLFLGPVFKLVTPSHFGILGPVFSAITLLVILFEGGIELRFDTLKTGLKGGAALPFVNFLVTMAAAGFVVYYFTEYNLLAGLIIGATLGGTSSAVVIPMVRQLKLGIKSKTILILESALTDVFCIIVVLALIEFELLGELKFGLMVGKILSSFLVALLIGCLGGLIWSILLNKIRNLHNSILTTPAFVMILYGIIEILGFSGPIGALAFGVTLANIELFKLPVITQLSNLKPITLNDTEKIMFSEIVFLLKTFFFIYIGISIQFTSVGSILFALVFTFGLLALRIIVVRFTYDKSISKRDASLSSIMMPRGLVAAVLASIPLQRGVVSGEFIQTVAYNVVLLSILLSSIMVFTIERTKLFRLFEWCFYGFSPSEKENVTQKKDGGHG